MEGGWWVVGVLAGGLEAQKKQKKRRVEPAPNCPKPRRTCSMMATFTSGYLLSSYAQERPAEPAPTITTSTSAVGWRGVRGGAEREMRREAARC